MRTSESKGHQQAYHPSVVLDLKFLYGLAATTGGTSNPPRWAFVLIRDRAAVRKLYRFGQSFLRGQSDGYRSPRFSRHLGSGADGRAVTGRPDACSAPKPIALGARARSGAFRGRAGQPGRPD